MTPLDVSSKDPVPSDFVDVDAYMQCRPSSLSKDKKFMVRGYIGLILDVATTATAITKPCASFLSPIPLDAHQ